MKLSTLFEDGHWKVVQSHPGGLGGSGKTHKKERLSMLKYPEDRGKFLTWLNKKLKKRSKSSPVMDPNSFDLVK